MNLDHILNNLTRVLEEKPRSVYENARKVLISEIGYHTFCELQWRAFSTVFEDMKPVKLEECVRTQHELGVTKQTF